MSAAMDPYRVLGLEADASQAEVKRAYRRLAKVLHPDAAGEGALPAFLAIQDAYERLTGTKVRTVRGPAGAGAAGGGAGGAGGPTSRASARAGSGPYEPWRADPARARAAREQARARRGWSGGQPAERVGTDPGRASTRSSSTRSGQEDRRGRPTPGATARDGADAGASTERGRAGGRRRPTRKATLGSTSYDEARDPADPSWAGASWYGPTTGEYWIVNPREYADPRKHGPGYTGRGRSGARAPADAPADEVSAPAPDPMRSADRAPDPAATAPSASARGAAAAREASRRSAFRAAPGGVDTVLGALGRASPVDPIRRLGLVLLAWPPLGIAAAAIIGRLTGCATYSTACDGTDPLLPWLAQAVLLGLLLLAPLLARVLAAGTVAALLALIPGSAVITALGGSGSAEGPQVLAGWLMVAWAAGVAWGIRRAASGSPAPGASA